MEIPWESLDEDLLLRLIDEVVTRDGTDYGIAEISRERKIEEVRAALKAKRAIIQWDVDSETVSIQEK
ncbi:UNVERIFIED_CONTAM: hypothetical protein GTU68_012975 [Idotea baltica]|nr:hypothetical protein [Idotea baltica]